MFRIAFRPFLLSAGLGCVLAAGPAIAANEAEIPVAGLSTDAPAQPLSGEAQHAIRLLKARDPYDRQAAFLELESTRDPALLPVLRPYLDDRDPEVRSYAVRAVAAIEGAASVPDLVRRLRADKNYLVRTAIILGLEPLQDPAILPALIERLRDRHPEVRMAALDAVSRFKAPEARKAILIRQRRERHRDVQRVLKDALQRVESPS